MADICLTESQRAVVEDRGGELLVSAAAGSGKTRVLVERLFDRVDRDGCRLDDFLIITYTRAAAAELRGRIAQELSARLAEDPGNRHLQDQFVRLYRADIKTVDSFCTALLREFVHLLDTGAKHSLTADFRVLDESEAALLRRRVLDRALEAFYAGIEEDPGRAELADSFGFGRDDKRLEALVLDLYDRLQSHPYPEEWLAEQRAVWEHLPQDVGETVWGGSLMAEFRRKAVHWRRLLDRAIEEMGEDPAVERGYAPAFNDVAGQLECMVKLASWDRLGQFPLAFPRLKPVKGESPLKTRCKTLWDMCKKELGAAQRVFFVSSQEVMEDLTATAPAMLALLDLTEAFSAAFQEEKTRRNVTDFSDQEHFAIRLLLERDGGLTEVGQLVSGRYREVMVDEYQDANEVQESIFQALGRGKLFTVGDVKQSIYRFRLADPTIFLEKYRQFPLVREREGAGRKILLSQNFRSRQEVLDGANFVFRGLMSEEMGEIDYGPDERLNFGAAYYPPRLDCQTEFHLLSLPMGMDGGPLAEARYVAERIAALLREGYPVSEGEGTRPCRPEDIVVLLRSPSPRLHLYAWAFRERDIPCAFGEDEDFFATMEIAVTFNLLMIVDNPRQDVPLISVLRSPVFGFTPDRLAQIRAKCPQGDFYDALTSDGGEDVRAFLAVLEELRLRSADLGVHRLLWHIYDRLHLLAVFGAMDGGRERRENLIALFDHARAFESAGYRGLFAFVTHLRRLLEEGQQPDTAGGSAGVGVRLMSIHKSKGLEFPIVILADLAKDFNRMDLQTPVLVHPKLGLGPTRIDLERRIRYPTAARDALARQLLREPKSEELRVLYVAMTRPKEKLILVASMKSAPRRLQRLAALAHYPVPAETVAAAGSMAEWLLLPLLRRPEAAALLDLAGIDVPPLATKDRPWQVVCRELGEEGVLQQPEEAGPEAEEAVWEPDFDPALLLHRYPFQAAETLQTKVTATELKGRPLDREIAEETVPPPKTGLWPRPRFVRQEAAVTAAERGTYTHLALQYLDLDARDVRSAVAEMVERGCLTAEQAAGVDRRGLGRFLASDLAAALRQAKRVEREYRFSLLVPAKDYLGEAAGEDEILLQGVVDCFFETEQGLTVVDFKTDYVTAETIQERSEGYRPQLTAYSAALARIFQKPVVRQVLYFLSMGREVEL